MALLFAKNIKKQIISELSSTSKNLHIISAYCKLDAIRFIEEHVTESIGDKKLMVRFQYDDIVSGASDLDLYDYCKTNNWELYARFDLHAKTYVFDRVRGIVGSANLTKSGIGLSATPNYEIAQLTSITYEEMEKIDRLFESAILMTDELYIHMKQCLAMNATPQHHSRSNWSTDILALFTQNIKVLFTHEFPNCLSLSHLSDSSLEFLGLSSGQDIDAIRDSFLTCNAYLWLNQQLQDAPSCEMYYGAITAALHNAMINDPKPYRKEVKELLSNLLNWIAELGIEEISIERPNHSQLIRLRQSEAT